MLKRLFNGYFWGYVKAVALRIAVAEDDEEEEKLANYSELLCKRDDEEEENTRITPNYYANGDVGRKRRLCKSGALKYCV